MRAVSHAGVLSAPAIPVDWDKFIGTRRSVTLPALKRSLSFRLNRSPALFLRFMIVAEATFRPGSDLDRKRHHVGHLDVPEDLV